MFDFADFDLPSPPTEPPSQQESIDDPIAGGRDHHAWRTWHRKVLAASVTLEAATQRLIAREANAAMANAGVFTRRELDQLLAAQQQARDLAAKQAAADAKAAAERAATAVVRREEFDRRVEAIERLLAGQAGGYPSIRTAFTDITGRTDVPSMGEFQRVFAGNFNSWTVHDFESVDSSTWANALGAAMHRRLVAEYATTPGLQAWRSIVSSTRTSTNFKTQKVSRIGGYGTLPVVAEGAPFQAFVTPADEYPASYSLTKRGGAEPVTLEAFANDDISVFRRVSLLLARAAANTLNRAVLDVLVANAAIYDSVALFHADHANTSMLALSGPNYVTVRTAMRKQTAYGDPTDVLGAVPRFLVVPPELEETALAIAETYRRWPSEDPALRTPVDVIVANHFASPTGWYMVADPRTVETIEVGFTTPTPDPEVFAVRHLGDQGDASAPDAVYFKIRHAWGLTVVDHRGLARGNT